MNPIRLNFLTMLKLLVVDYKATQVRIVPVHLPRRNSSSSSTGSGTDFTADAVPGQAAAAVAHRATHHSTYSEHRDLQNLKHFVIENLTAHNKFIS